MDGNGTARQVMWQGTTAVDLGLDPACQVVDLNDSGHIVGNSGADVIIWVQGVIHAPAFEPTALATYASHTDQHCGCSSAARRTCPISPRSASTPRARSPQTGSGPGAVTSSLRWSSIRSEVVRSGNCPGATRDAVATTSGVPNEPRTDGDTRAVPRGPEVHQRPPTEPGKRAAGAAPGSERQGLGAALDGSGRGGAQRLLRDPLCVRCPAASARLFCSQPRLHGLGGTARSGHVPC